MVIKVGARSNFGGTVPIMRYDKHTKGFLRSVMRLTLTSKQFVFDVFNHFLVYNSLTNSLEIGVEPSELTNIIFTLINLFWPLPSSPMTSSMPGRGARYITDFDR